MRAKWLICALVLVLAVVAAVFGVLHFERRQLHKLLRRR